MTAVIATSYRPWTHRAAVRLGRALTEWGDRSIARAPLDAERVARMEAARDRATRALPQLPR